MPGIRSILVAVTLFLLTAVPAAHAQSACARSVPMRYQLERLFGMRCDSITEAALAAVQDLTLGLDAQDVLDENDLRGFTGLTYLKLEAPYSQVGLQLPQHLFDSVPQLQTLDLQRFAMRNFTPALFAPLARLKTLSFTVAILNSAVPRGLFQGLVGLEALTLSADLARFSPESFEGLGAVKQLSLIQTDAGRAQPSLVPHYFARMPHLEELAIFGDNFLSVPAGTFRGLSHLRRLVVNLTASEYSTAPDGVDGIFEGLDHLQTLEILNRPVYRSNSNVCGIYSGLPALEHLKVTAYPRAVTPHCFSQIPQLKNIDLDIAAGARGGTDVEASAFEELTALETLRFTADPAYVGREDAAVLRLADHAFDGLRSLKELDFTDQRISGVRVGMFAPVPNLETLKLGGNRLTAIPAGLFQGLSRLTVLGLERNGLTDFDVSGILNADQIARLTRLDLSANPLPADLVRRLYLIFTSRVLEY